MKPSFDSSTGLVQACRQVYYEAQPLLSQLHELHHLPPILYEDYRMEGWVAVDLAVLRNMKRLHTLHLELHFSAALPQLDLNHASMLLRHLPEHCRVQQLNARITMYMSTYGHEHIVEALRQWKGKIKFRAYTLRTNFASPYSGSRRMTHMSGASGVVQSRSISSYGPDYDGESCPYA